MPKFTIDGQEIEVAPGTTVLQAALQQGAVVPHYCYHPGLSIAGNCRMCLVQVEKAPKLMIGCATEVTDGMVVHTRNERVQTAQAAVMEFLLINHPLDCTICDQAGECRLQEYAVEYGTGRSRYEDPKVLQNKAVDIGKHVMLDQERCIQCSRCTRFCDEITGTGELAFFRRGEKTIIGTYPGKHLDNPYSGNTVDICPVGALTLKEFRFQARVWYLKSMPTVCAGCSRGCNTIVSVGTQQEQWTSAGQFDDRIKRVVPRHNEAVNGHWMCDEGRLSYLRPEAAERPMTAQAPAGTESSYADAVTATAAKLRTAAESGRSAAIFSPRLLTETIFAWHRLFAELGTVRSGLRRLHSGSDDELLIRADKGANSLGAAWILGERTDEKPIRDAIARGEIDTLVVFGDTLDPQDTAPIDAATRGKLNELIYVGPFVDETAKQATVLLPACSWAEEDGTMVNFEGHVQQLRRCHRPRGEGRPGWRIAADVAAEAGVDLPTWPDAAAVLATISETVEPMRGLDLERIGLLGAQSAATPAA